MRRKLITSLFTFFLFSSITQAQVSSSGYLFPINPGQQNYLAGTMGELRATHFHAGIDIKTGGVEGLPVYAAKDGYVSRIKVSPTGYGNALYVTHPDGNTTVYAHLKNYNETIAAYILAEQYKKKGFAIQIYPEKDQFPVKQGDVIAYSGNTGSSSGPHLHFEIRDRNQDILDPLSFGFKEIEDHRPPLLVKIAFTCLDKNARVNNLFGRKSVNVYKNADGTYRLNEPISISGKVGIELYAYDQQDGVPNKNGVKITALAVDNDTIFMESKDRLSFSTQRHIMQHMNYEAYKTEWIKYNKLYVDKGNKLPIYLEPSFGHQFDKQPHEIVITMQDSYGNRSVFSDQINLKPVKTLTPEIDNHFEISRNVLHIRAKTDSIANLAKIYAGQAYVELSPYFTDKANAYYIWDLKDGLPDSINLCGETIPTHLITTISAGEETTYYNHTIDLKFEARDLFDTFYLQYGYTNDTLAHAEYFHFYNEKTPLKSWVDVTLKPRADYDEKKTRVYAVNGKSLSYEGGSWSDGKINFRTRTLGNFTLAADTSDPIISPVSVNKNELIFKISDDLSGIKSYRASINGEFVLMYYDPKRRLIWSEKLKTNIPFSGELKLTVTDNTGNQSIYTKTL